MPYSKAHKQRVRQCIINSALELFSRKGFDNVSIDELMLDAGLTRGAFYNHFNTKSEVYAEAIMSAISGSRLTQEKPIDLDNKSWLKKLLLGYLSREHIQQEVPPCPLAFFVTDVATRDAKVRNAYTKVYDGLNQVIGKQLADKGNGGSVDTAFVMTAMMIGGVAIGRALDDSELVEKVLASCRQHVQFLLEFDAADNERGS